MKTWLRLLCCSISFFLLTGCASLNFWSKDKSPPPSTVPAPPPPSPPSPPTPVKDISFNWIYFDYSKAILTEEAAAALDEIVRVLKENPSISIELAGHTDGRGTDAYNLRLSERRVQSVHEYLVSGGISNGRLRIAAFGKARPVADDRTKEGRAQNRRVEIRIIK